MQSDNDPTDSQDCEEIVEETLIHVVVDNADEMSTLNANSNVRVIAIESDSPALQIENKVPITKVFTSFFKFQISFHIKLITI